MPVMRISDHAAEVVTQNARPLESRPQVLDRLLKLATQGPPEEWLTEAIGEGMREIQVSEHSSMNSPGIAGQAARYALSRWHELRERGLAERLGPDPEPDGGESDETDAG